MTATRALTGLLAVGWLPGSVAVVGAGMGGGWLTPGAEGWVYLAAGGMPLGLGWLTLRETRPSAAWWVLALLTPLVMGWCALASGWGPGMQAAGAAGIGVGAWLPLATRRRRRKAVWVLDPAMPFGLLLR